MFKNRLAAFIILAVVILLSLAVRYDQKNPTGAPPFGIPEEEAPDFGSLAWVENWQRPDGPARVALQAGHWKNDELPEELEKHRDSTGSTAGGCSEVEVNLKIAEAAAKILEEKGVLVEILPATIPPSYWADVFAAIHTDGSLDPTARGFKAASPWRDFTGQADELAKLIMDSYEETTDLPWDDNISKDMRGYYAFAWWKYEHSLHPMTTAVIIETGFLTNYADRQTIVENPELAAEGLASGILKYLEGEGLLRF